MYEDRLGTDWEDISAEEAIRRAYALGVAAAFGYENREEFDRLRNALDTSYDRSIIDLAYQEGKQEAAVVHTDGEADDGEAVWSQLVEGATPHKPGDDSEDAPDSGSLVGTPIAAVDLPTLLDGVNFLDAPSDLDVLGFPDLIGSSPGRDDREES